ncbi:MAG TPA: hypothetical protein VHQ94_12745 [Pyrinomonadaceae bacterium]|jgi:hypothetical protein|nr:hypothetical protein [Pyrinomonadaceae bacterium]
MRINWKTSKWVPWILVLALSLTAVTVLNFGTRVSADGGNDLGTSPFDFSDATYRAHGIVPENIVLRVGTAARGGDFVIDNTNTDPNRSNVRTIETTPGTTGSSGLTYANIFGVLNSTSFERNASGQLTARGQAAFDTAEHFRVFIFPKASNGSILDPFLPNKRQDNLFDTRDGYFSNDPLGMWVAVWVVYTPKAFTASGHKELDPIAATNGRDLDGTPILTSPSQVDNLAAKGFIELRTRPVDDAVFRWVICPIPEDPRDGFIRPDAFIRDVKRADGTAVFPALGNNFRCLQQSGAWCN